VGVAAALGLGVVGLRSLDRAPSQLPTGAEKRVATPGNPVVGNAPAKKMDEDDGEEPGDPGTDTGPTTAPEPEPLQGGAKELKPAASGAATADVPPPAASSTPKSNDPAPAGVVRINVDSDPPGARMFWKGKEVGTTPFVLELAPGERHAYELGMPGYITRKVVIDGSKTEISIGLRPDLPVPTGGKPRK
jgi:hypothetical protein